MSGKTYLQLRAELAELDEKIEETRERERVEAIATIHGLMDRYNIKHADLIRDKGSRGDYRTKAVVPVYRDPASGREWSGRGNPPLWIRGRDRLEFLIPGSNVEDAR